MDLNEFPLLGKAVQELTLEKDDVVEGAIIPLTYVKFQNVCSVTVFVKDNQGEVLSVSSLRAIYFSLRFESFFGSNAMPFCHVSCSGTDRYFTR